MLSPTSPPSAAKLFRNDWTLTLPSKPNLRYIHATPSTANLATYLAILRNPANFPHDPTFNSEPWDDAAIAEWKTGFETKFVNARTAYNKMVIFIEDEGEVVGSCDYFLHPTGSVNLGMMLEEKARGKGLGKLTVQVLIQLAREQLGVEKLEAGTMKSNVSMRAIMQRLGVPEHEEVVDIPGRGVVAEVLFKIPSHGPWENLQPLVDVGHEVHT